MRSAARLYVMTYVEGKLRSVVKPNDSLCIENATAADLAHQRIERFRLTNAKAPGMDLIMDEHECHDYEHFSNIVFQFMHGAQRCRVAPHVRLLRSH